MGRFQSLNDSCSTPLMDIDPRTSSWNSLNPSFLYAGKNRRHLEENICDHVIGSPPPKGPPKHPWQEVHVDGENNNHNDTATAESKMASEPLPHPATTNGAGNNESDTLALRVQEMQLQQEPLIICENVEDDKLDGDEDILSDSDSLTLTVPPVDIADERKRPPY